MVAVFVNHNRRKTERAFKFARGAGFAFVPDAHHSGKVAPNLIQSHLAARLQYLSCDCVRLRTEA